MNSHLGWDSILQQVAIPGNFRYYRNLHYSTEYCIVLQCLCVFCWVLNLWLKFRSFAGDLCWDLNFPHFSDFDCRIVAGVRKMWCSLESLARLHGNHGLGISSTKLRLILVSGFLDLIKINKIPEVHFRTLASPQSPGHTRSHHKHNIYTCNISIKN